VNEGRVFMMLCIGIVEDNLSRKIEYKNYFHLECQFVLERCEIFCRGNQIFNAGVLYVAYESDLPEKFTVQDGAALICIGMPKDEYKKSAMPLLVLDASTDLFELVNDVSNIFVEYNTLEDNLQNAVNKGRSIQCIVDYMSPYLNGNELIVGYPDFRIVGRSNETIHTFEISGLEQPDENGVISEENVSFFKNDMLYKELRTKTEPFIYEPGIYICRSIGMNVFRGGDIVRVHIFEDVNSFRGYELGLAKFFANFIQLVYSSTVDTDDLFPRNQLKDFFVSMLKGEHVESQKLVESMLEHSWIPDGPFVCASILPSERDFYNQTIQYYCDKFNKEMDGCCFFEHQGVIICVLNLAFYAGTLDLFLKKHLETFMYGNFRIGYSNTLTELSELNNYYTQASIALKFGLRIKPTQWFFQFSDIVLHYLESKMTEDLGGKYLCAPEILTLHEYDMKNQTEFLKTLQVYIENQMNALKAADALFIHRTTMTYRLSRIKKLTGIDFKNHTELMYLSISIKFLFKENTDW
jgi:hypothetical protein